MFQSDDNIIRKQKEKLQEAIAEQREAIEALERENSELKEKQQKLQIELTEGTRKECRLESENQELLKNIAGIDGSIRDQDSLRVFRLINMKYFYQTEDRMKPSSKKQIRLMNWKLKFTNWNKNIIEKVQSIFRTLVKDNLDSEVADLKVKLVDMGYSVNWDELTVKGLSSTETATATTLQHLVNELDQLEDDILDIHKSKKKVSEGKTTI